MDQADKKTLKLSEAGKATLKKVRDSLRVTKVVCTRSVKGKAGDHYVGFSAAWDTIQDDAGGAVDLMPPQGGQETALSVAAGGLTLKEARIAAILLGAQTDTAAYEHAYAGGDISKQLLADAKTGIQNNYGRLLMEALGEEQDSTVAGS